MSTTIDERVVEMRFDNRQFESNVSTTMSSLDKLKQKLNLDGATRGMESISKASGELEISATRAGFHISDVWEKVTRTIEQKFANRIIDAGKRIGDAIFGVTSMKTGFDEYETKIGSIQTIMSNTASKGTTMEDVTGVLNKLNTYADKTIYNFAEMTRNIGTFTAAGVGLEESAAAIQGISNLAAASGSTSQQASTAMYQLSQAMSSGVVKLMDWNSVVNAGMGGEKFQEALKATAREHGVAVDEMIKENGSFRESLQEGWLSADILNETLRKFTVEGAKEYADSMVKSGKYTQEQADALIKEAQSMEDAATKVKTFTQLWDTLKESAQSGWAQSWEIIVGDFEEARAFLTEVSDKIGGAIGKVSDARNEMLEDWKTLGGRDDLIAVFNNLYDAVTRIVNPIKEAFRSIFLPVTGESLKKLTEGFANFTSKLVLSEEASDNLKSVLAGVFATIDILWQVLKGVYKAIEPILKFIVEIVGWLFKFCAAVGDMTVDVDGAIKSGNLFQDIGERIGEVFQFIIDKIKNFGSFLKGIFTAEPIKAFGVLLRAILARFIGLKDEAGEVGSALSDAFSRAGDSIKNSAFFKVLTTVWGAIKTVVKAIGTAFTNLFKSIAQKLATGDLVGLFDILNGFIAGGLGLGLIKLINTIRDFLNPDGDGPWAGIREIGQKFGGLLDSIGGAFESFQNRINAGTLKTIATAILILVAALVVVSFIDKDKLLESTAVIVTFLASMLGALKMLGKMDLEQLAGIKSLSSLMLSMSISLLLMAAVAKILGGMEWEAWAKGMIGIPILLGTMTGAVVAMRNFFRKSEKEYNMQGMQQGAKAMRSMAWTLILLAIPCKILGGMEWDEWGRAMMGIPILLGSLVAAAVILKKNLGTGAKSTTVAGVNSMVTMAWALTLLAIPCAILGLLPWEAWGRAMIGIPVLLGVLVGAVVALTKLTQIDKANKALTEQNIAKLTSAVKSVVILAAALLLLVPVIITLALIPWEGLAKAGVGILGLLTLLVGATAILSLLGQNATKAVLGASAIAIITGALNLIIPTLLVLSVLPLLLFAKAIITLTVVLGLLIGAVALMSTLGIHGVIGAAGIAILCASLNLLIPVFAVLGAMPILSIAKALISITAAFAIMGAAGLLLAPLAPIIALLAASFLVLGVGMLAAGAGAILFGNGLLALAAGAAAIAASGAIIVKAIQIIIVGVIEAIGLGIVAFCNVISGSVEVIVSAIISIIGSLLDACVTLIPSIVRGLLEIVVSVLAALAENAPALAGYLFEFVVAVIDQLANYMVPLIEALSKVFYGLIEGVISALGNMDTKVLVEHFTNIGLLAGIMAALAAMNILAPLAMAGVLAMVPAVMTLYNVVSMFGLMAQLPGLKWLASEGGGLLQTLCDALSPVVWKLLGIMTALTLMAVPAVVASASIGVISAVVAKLTILLATLGAIKQIPGIDWLITEGGAFMAKLAGILGEMVGSFVGGIAEGFTSHLANIADDFSAFMEHIQPFITGLRNIDASVMDGAKTLVGTILMFTGASFVQALADWFTGGLSSMSRFSEELVELGKGIRGFADEVAGIDAEGVNAAAQAAKALADMTKNIPNEGGIASWFAGENSIAKFAKEIVQLGFGLKGFAAQVAGIDPEAVTAAAKAGQALAEMTNAIPNENGMVQWFTGEKSVSKFAEEMPKLGAGLKKFATEVTGIKPEAVTAAATAASSIAEMTNAIPNEKGIAQWFTGEKSLSKFSEDMPKLGKGLAGFSKELGEGFNPENVKAAATAAKSIADMTSVIPNEGGIAAWFTGENSISTFAGKLPKLGEGLAGFSSALGEEFKPENVASAAEAGKHIAEMANDAPGDTEKLSNLCEKLPTLAEKMKSFFEKLKGITAESMSNAKKAIKAVQEIASSKFDDVSSMAEAINDIVKAITKLKDVPNDIGSNFKKSMQDLGSVSAESFLKEFKDIKDDMKKAGKSALESFVSGVNETKKSATEAIKSVASAGVDAAKDKYQSFYDAGSYLVDGFAAGISENDFKAAAKATAMAKAALKAAEEALDENSPSKEFYKVGAFAGQGFVNALGDYANTSYDAGSKMADSSRAGIRDAISKVTDFINSDMDTQPTIRPVLDLSDIRSGAGLISGMFGESSVGVVANAGTISTMMNRGSQNGVNSDVVSAIAELRKDIKDIKSDTYNINGITYDDGSAVSNAVRELIRAARVERRV